LSVFSYSYYSENLNWAAQNLRLGRMRAAVGQSCIIPFFPGPMVTAGCFKHSKHIIQHAQLTHSFAGSHQNLSA